MSKQPFSLLTPLPHWIDSVYIIISSISCQMPESVSTRKNLCSIWWRYGWGWGGWQKTERVLRQIRPAVVVFVEVLLGNKAISFSQCWSRRQSLLGYWLLWQLLEKGPLSFIEFPISAQIRVRRLNQILLWSKNTSLCLESELNSHSVAGEAMFAFVAGYCSFWLIWQSQWFVWCKSLMILGILPQKSHNIYWRHRNVANVSKANLASSSR